MPPCSAPPRNKRMPAHLWKPTVSGHFAFLFDTSESIRLVVFAEPTVWLYNGLMPNQSIASMPPIAGQRRYPLKVLYTVDVALQGKTRLSRRCAKMCRAPEKGKSHEESCDSSWDFGALEGTRIPGPLIKRAHRASYSDFESFEFTLFLRKAS